MIARVVFASLLAAGLPLIAQTGSEFLKSPDGALEFVVETLSANNPAPSGGQLAYRVNFKGQPLVTSSQLGLDLEGQNPLGAAVRIASASRASADETYRLVAGKNNPVRDHYNSMRVELAETGRMSRRLTLEVRAYNDGVAFRYLVPDQTSPREFRLVRELTQFRFAKDATAYPLQLASFRTSYENIFVKMPLSRFAAEQLVGLPLLLESPGLAWVAITEADLKDYAGMYLAAGKSGGLEARLSPSLDHPGLVVSGLLPHRSPWRLMMIASEPGRLIESNLVVNLNPPSEIQDTSWIRAGKASWSWWSGNSATGASGVKGGMNTETMKYYADFAANAGLEYMLIDAGWSSRNDIANFNPNVNVPEIVKYAAAKNVKVWLWLHWTSADRQMDEAFPMYEKWGVAGVKIDFMDSNDQRMVAFYHRTAKKAAEHRLMIDFHGAFPPTGMRRTWPNVMTHEGVLGLEYSKWSAMPDPEHNVMLAFTRMLAGPMDYTPGGFENVTRAAFAARQRDPMTMGTRAHQLALYVVFEGYFQMVSDRPGAYTDQPAFEFIKSVPAAWEQTKVLNGEVREYVTIARRLGKEWFVGSITNWTPRDQEIPLGFLPDGKFEAEIYADAADADRAPKNVAISKRGVDRRSTLKFRLAPGGGVAIRIRPA